MLLIQLTHDHDRPGSAGLRDSSNEGLQRDVMSIIQHAKCNICPVFAGDQTIIYYKYIYATNLSLTPHSPNPSLSQQGSPYVHRRTHLSGMGPSWATILSWVEGLENREDRALPTANEKGTYYADKLSKEEEETGQANLFDGGLLHQPVVGECFLLGFSKGRCQQGKRSASTHAPFPKGGTWLRAESLKWAPADPQCLFNACAGHCHAVQHLPARGSDPTEQLLWRMDHAEVANNVPRRKE